MVWGGESSGTAIGNGWAYSTNRDSWRTLPSTGAPSARSRHAGVWTGTEFIIWGGGANTNTNGPTTLAYTLTGARYDPVANSWVTMSTNGAPEVREEAQAVWTGTEMIVWGGRQIFDNAGIRTTNYLSTGGRYSPATDSWQPLPTNAAPSGRYNHASVWTGSEFMVWGGRAEATNPPSGGRYSPSLNQWLAISTTNAPSPRHNIKAVWTGNRVAIWGGNSIGTRPFADGFMYDPATDSWETMNPTNAPEARYWASLVVANGELIIWAGFATTNSVNTGGRYDLTTHQWTAMSTNGAPTSLGGFTQPWHTSWDGNQMLAWGQASGSTTRSYRYQPNTDTWSTDSMRSSTTVGQSVVWTGDRLLIWGGGLSGPLPRDDGWSYDLTTDRWEYVPPDPAAGRRQHHSVVWNGTEMIIWGGLPNLTGQLIGTNTGTRYNPVTKAWTAITTNGAPSARWGHVTAWTGTEMLIWGSANNSQTGGRYRLGTDSWSPINTTGRPTGGIGPCAVWTGDRWIIWGGNNVLGAVNTGAIYDAGTDSWLAISTTNAPAARWNAACVWTGSEFIVWGGNAAEGVFLNDGARYNPTTQTWTPISSVGAPSPRGGAVGLWTGSEMIVYGREGNGTLRQAFHYSPATDTWSQPAPEGVPTQFALPDSETLRAVWTGNRVMAVGLSRVEIYGPSIYSDDTIPNAWQTQHFGRDNPLALDDQDPDGDGRNNLFEFITGTIPTREDSFFQTAIALNSSNQQPAVVSYSPALTNRLYTLEWTTNFTEWFDASNSVPSAAGPWTGLFDADATNISRNYRVRVSLP